MTWAELFSELAVGLQTAFDARDYRSAQQLSTQLGNMLRAHGAAGFPEPATTGVHETTVKQVRGSSIPLAFSS
jgi:hypothetical protein